MSIDNYAYIVRYLERQQPRPPIKTEGWYTTDSSKWAAEGDNVLEDAYAAWEATAPQNSMSQQLANKVVAVSAIGKLGAHTGGSGVTKNNTLHKGDFSDAVILLHNYDQSSGSAVVELCEPRDREEQSKAHRG